jgi:hypothetical protein
MASTVAVVSLTGATPDINEITADRYCTTDAVDPGLAYANQVPSSGQTNRSYWKHRGIHIKGGTFSQLSNFRWGGPGTVKTDWGLESGLIQVALRDSGDPGCPLASYDQAAGVEGQYGYDLKDGTNGHTYYKSQVVACADMDSYTSSSPLVFDSSVKTATGYTKFVVTQLIIEDDTNFGEKSILYEFWKWAEI